MRQTLAFERLTPAPGLDADEASHEFVAFLELTDEDLAGDVLLQAHGLATVAEVEVNGVGVLTSTSMFERSTVLVDQHVHVGTNEVLVRCLPIGPVLDAAPRRPRARWRTMLTEEPRLRWLRTSILGRAPGFAPAPAVVGPFRPVVVETRAMVRVERLDLVAVLGHLSGTTGATGTLDVSLDVRGAEQVVLQVTGPDGRSSETELPARAEHVRIEVPDVAPWWPHTHGPPQLYDVRLRHAGIPLDLPGDATTRPDVRRVGFRTVVNTSPDSLALCVNDVAVFVRGAVWTPGDLDALDTAVELGLNLIRVSGITAYESDAFHARCDELGLLVWQDLMFATFDYPLADDDFRATVGREVTEQSARLLGHPSTVVVCGSAEHEQQAAMSGVRPDTGAAGELAALLRPVVEASGLDALWVASSPSGGDLPIRVDTGVAQYFGVGASLRDLPDARHSGVRFASECLAFSNLPGEVPGDLACDLSDRSDPVGVPRDNGSDWDFADVRRHYLTRRHGPAASLAAEQRVTGEVMADVFGEWRRPASGCSGGIVLWLRDLEPGAGWGLLDHAGRPKPAALALAPTLRSTAVWLVDEGLNGLDVHVAHDGPEPVAMALHVALLRADGSAVDEADATWEMSGHDHRVHGVGALLGRFADPSYAYRFGPAAHVAVQATLTGAFGTHRATWRPHDPTVDWGQ